MEYHQHFPGELERRAHVRAVVPVVLDKAGEISFGGFLYRVDRDRFVENLRFLLVQPESLGPLQVPQPTDEVQEALTVVDEIKTSPHMTIPMIESIVDQKREERQLQDIWYTVFWKSEGEGSLIIPYIRLYRVPLATVDVGVSMHDQTSHGSSKEGMHVE